jgi:cell division septum initiation protein DivIVA
LRALLLVAAALILLVATGGDAGAARPPSLRGGDPLQRLRSEGGLVATTGPERVVRVGLPRGEVLIWLVLASTAMLAVVVPGIISKRPLRLASVGVPSPEGGVQMRFIDRKDERATQEESTVEATEAEQREAGPSAAATRIAAFTGEPTPERRAPTFDELGQHVASVLQSAREAAERIVAEARSEAARVQERSQKDAEATVAEARRKAGELDAEASQARSEAKREARDLRARADEYAEEKRQEADEAAAEILARAERVARERAAAAEERQRALDENVERTEERLRQLVGGLRDLAGRLDVLASSGDGAEPDADAALDEELTRSAAGHAASTETASPAEADAR